MDERTYTIHVIRVSDAMLWDLQVKSKTAIPGDSGMFNALSPGYVPEKTGYLSKVGAQVSVLSLWLLRKEGVTIKYRYQIEGETPSAVMEIAPNPNAPEDKYTAEIAFPAAKEWVEFTVEASMEIPLPTPHTESDTYTVKVVRPFKVDFDPAAITAGFTGEISGISPYRFAVGNIVSFTLTPPFGTTTSTVTYSYTPSGGSTVTGSINPSSSHLYALIMPDADVVISGTAMPVPAAEGLNVRYVREGGKPYGTGPGQADAKTWVTATNNLQALIEAFDPATGGGNYEIWVARGTYAPDWSAISSASWYSGAPSSAPSHRWAFVLKNGVRIYGGFNGSEKNQSDREGRDYRANLTTLSGNLGDQGTVLCALVAAGTSSTPLTAYIEGLTVNGGYNVLGYGDEYQINGNNMKNTMSHPEIPTYPNDVFTGNILHLVNARVLCKNVDFDSGQAMYASGIAVWANARLALVNCTVKGSQSAGYGSAVSLLAGTSRLVMIGGLLHLNWDAGGVFAIDHGQALLVNARIADNHENPVKVRRSGKGWFINTSITGNKGTVNSDAIETITTEAREENGVTEIDYGDAYLYNSVVRGNFLQTYGKKVWFYNTIAPDINGFAVTRNGTTSLAGGQLVDQGTIGYYPLDTGGNWNTGAPGYSVITDIVGVSSTPGTWEYTAANEIKAALLKDGNGNSRFNGTIDLGAVEE
jgi:hypothetical protein